jgi:hypothetical protein
MYPHKEVIDHYPIGIGKEMEMMTRYAGVLLLILVTVMFGGASLLRILIDGDMLNDWQIDQFRAGHAHAGVLLILGLVYTIFLERTRWTMAQRRVALVILVSGGVSQSGGFFLHILVGEPEAFSAGTAMTLTGAVLLASAVIALGVSLIRHGGEEEWTV